MALATESAGRVRQKAYNFLQNSTGTSTASISPYHLYALKSLFLHLAGNKGNPDLQYIPYTAEQAVTNAGYSPDVDACHLYAWFGKARRTSGTTAAFESLLDGTAGSDSDAVTTHIAINRIRTTGESFVNIWPDGYAIATDLVVISTTLVAGVTESSAANSTDGFLIIGA